MSCGLPSALGSCTATPAGLKPRSTSDCKAEEKSTCGLDGTCDGAGKCRAYEAGTVCRAGTCDGDAVGQTFVCDGQRGCKVGAITVCAPYSCDRTTNLCFPMCTSDTDCVAGRKCVMGQCGKKMNGAICQQNNECASEHCADGVCCNTACSGACRACNLVGQIGTCGPIAEGLPHALCAKQAATTCGTTGACDGFGTCSVYPQDSPCGPSTCSGVTAMNSARTCDGVGTCQPSELSECGAYRCATGACNHICTTNADCADGIACVAGSCGPKVDGQPCTADGQCLNQHCVSDTAGGPGICCNTACAGACRSCGLTGSLGRCTPIATGLADPRHVCTDMTAATCGTDGRCDGTGACRHYAPDTVCAPETCVTDVYTGPSTCNDSGQCIKPPANPCFPFRCNATKCFGSCTTNAQCISPNTCGMDGMISSCGLKPPGAACSAGTECQSTFCAQGVCCNSACNTACHACNLPTTNGICSNVASGADPQGMCAVQAQSTCGTTGQCAAGQCARFGTNTQCVAPACATASTRTPPSMCNGTGMCVTPANTNCAPGRCDATTLTCNSTCTTNAQCTAPATCVGGSCGLQPIAGPCSANNQCQTGLTCYLTEGTPGVCCNSACTGTCESCRIAGAVGTCTAVAAGATDPDPATACVAATNPNTCGLDGRCAGNNSATNAAGTARCRFLGTGQGCRNQSCVDSTVGGTVSTLTAAANCTGAGACGPVTTSNCGTFKCLNATQCATSCTTDANCVGVACNLQTHRCGEKLGNGSLCVAPSDCTSNFCVDGRCCGTACTGACQTCNNTAGNCVAVANDTADPLCLPVVAPCGRTGMCTGGACANTTNGTSCSDGNPCNGVESCQAGTCSAGTPVTCRAADQCHVAGTCAPATGLCSNPNAANGTVCNDNSMCTSGDTCTAGVCGGAAVPINDNNPCTTDSCSATGGVVHTAVANGTSCADATVCNGAETCQAGVCTPGTAPATNDNNPCTTDSCDPATGVAHTPVANGTSCSDGNACNGAETCQAGVCAAGTAVACTSPPVCHTATGATCAPATGACTYPNAATDTRCGDGNACNGAETCQAGVCAAGTAVACTSPPVCHTATGATCAPATGACTYPNATTDTRCGDADACNGVESCQAGTCARGTAVTCTSPPVCHTATGATCAPENGACTYPAVTTDARCGDGDACNGVESCQAGSCAQGTPVVCPRPTECHLAGACDPASGTCSTPNAPATTLCGDGLVCKGSMLKQPDHCDGQGMCQPATPDPCPNGQVCTTTTMCGTPDPVVCADGADCLSTTAPCTCPGLGICVPDGNGGGACLAIITPAAP